MFAVVGRGLYAKEDPEHFGSIFSALFTLFQLLTLDDWFEIHKTVASKGALVSYFHSQYTQTVLLLLPTGSIKCVYAIRKSYSIFIRNSKHILNKSTFMIFDCFSQAGQILLCIYFYTSWPNTSSFSSKFYNHE